MITFEYPTWFVLLCFALGSGYAIFFYLRERAFEEHSVGWTRMMALLRGTVVTLLALLLLSPLVKAVHTETKKPVVVVAQDNSESVAAARTKGNTDTAAYSNAVRKLARDLGDKYEVHTYSFGDKVRESLPFDYTDKASNISALLDEVYDTYTNQNLGAVVVATDGIYNQGANPVYTATKLGVPIYTIALGDTVPKKDVVLKRVYHNQIAYLGDKFTVQADIVAHNCKGTSTTLDVAKVNGKGAAKLTSKTLAIDKEDFFATQEIELSADAVGVQRYRLALSTVNGEATTANNSKEIVVEVIDARQKVLILANAPHPDLSALKQTLTENKNYDVSLEYISEFKGDVSKYDLFILHEIPGTTVGNAATVLQQIAAARKARWFILGNQTNLQELSRVETVVRINGTLGSTNEVQGVLASNFQLFTPSPAFIAELPKLPPLLAPFGEYTTDPTAQPIIMQKIGSITSKYPLLVVSENESTGKVAVLAGEGIFKWRIEDYVINKNFNAFNEFINQIAQYLTVKEDKRKFRAFTNKTVYDENENIVIDAELYNDAYKRINDPEAKIVLTGDGGKEYAFTFTKTADAYTLNAGLLPVGDYAYKATANYNGNALLSTGQFSIRAVQLEAFETTADHRLLRALANQNGGTMVFPNNIASLAALLTKNNALKPVMYSTLKTYSLIHLKWIFFLLLGMLSVEWFARKYFGGY